MSEPRLETCAVCKGTGYRPPPGRCRNPQCPYGGKVQGSLVRVLKLPPAFIRDCLDCDCDIGTYDFARRELTASVDQIDELRDRAEYYVDAHGPDASPPGLKVAARAVLKALRNF